MPKNKKILMVDDDAEDRMLMQDMLTEIGAQSVAHYADCGEAALHYLESLPQNELPNVILLDVNMPRLNGKQVLKMLKKTERFKHITVIIYSTSVNNVEKEQMLELGAHSYMIKPSSYADCLENARYFNQLCLTIEGCSKS